MRETIKKYLDLIYNLETKNYTLSQEIVKARREIQMYLNEEDIDNFLKELEHLKELKKVKRETEKEIENKIKELEDVLKEIGYDYNYLTTHRIYINFEGGYATLNGKPKEDEDDEIYS